MKTYEERKKETCEWCAAGVAIDIARQRRNEDGVDENRHHMVKRIPEPPQHIAKYTDYTTFNVPNKWNACTALSHEDYEAELRAEIQRLWDLARHQRSALLTADLLTFDEYDALAADTPSRSRLERYDSLRARLDAAESAERAFHCVATVIQGAFLNGQLPPISGAELAEKIITEYGRKQASSYEQGKRADVMEKALRVVHYYATFALAEPDSSSTGTLTQIATAIEAVLGVSPQPESAERKENAE